MSFKPLIMGIVNTTPDSFFDGGKYTNFAAAFARAGSIIEQGAAIIDIGGYSTRPGAKPVTAEDELARTVPLIKQLRQSGVSTPISIDSFTPQVVQSALESGANIVNDVGGLANIHLAQLALKHKAKLVIMHTRGTPQTMQTMCDYDDILTDIANFFESKIKQATTLGFDKADIILDIGLGFAKTREQNWFLLQNLKYFDSFGLPMLVGASRKSFTDKTLDGSLKAAALAVKAKAAILRVHDVQETVKYIEGII